MKTRTLMTLALTAVFAAGLHEAPAGATRAEPTVEAPVEALVGSGLWDKFACTACLAGVGASMVPFYGNFVLAAASLADGWLANKCIEVCFMTL